MMISLIVACAQNAKGDYVIGLNNKLPWYSPEDLKRFREFTWGCPIIMGRKTHESIGRILPGRKNIILSRRRDFSVPGACVVSSPEEALREAAPAPEVFVIGGEQIYSLFLEKADRIYFTLIKGKHDGDAFFPRFHWQRFHKIQQDSNENETFYLLQRKNYHDPVGAYEPTVSSGTQTTEDYFDSFTSLPYGVPPQFADWQV